MLLICRVAPLENGHTPSDYLCSFFSLVFLALCKYSLYLTVEEETVQLLFIFTSVRVLIGL